MGKIFSKRKKKLPIAKIVKMNKDITFLLDRSSSMSTYGAAALAEGVMEVISTWKETAKNENIVINFTFVVFDHQIVVRYDEVDISTISPTHEELVNWVSPRGSTKLYDAGVTSLRSQLQRVEGNPYLNPSDLIFILFTDGEDSSSVEFIGPPNDKGSVLREELDKFQKEGGTALFPAANGMAFLAENLGFKPDNAIDVSNTGGKAHAVFRSIACAGARGCSGAAPTWTKTERQVSAPDPIGQIPNPRRRGGFLNLVIPPPPRNQRQTTVPMPGTGAVPRAYPLKPLV